MSTKVVIMFPYSGYDSGSDRERLFWKTINLCRRMTANPRPVVVLNKDTERRGQAGTFLADPRLANVDIHKVWSVDTCQMWLAGWGYVIDGPQNVSRIVQLPGDLDMVKEEVTFFNSLRAFVALSEPWDIIIGDFSTGERFGAKDLIDQYGTYALLANWFPEISQKILSLPLNKPRSEFLNIRVRTLEELLNFRKFAYEQTLNMLIRSWDLSAENWRYQIHSFQLGTLQDEIGFRRYRDCLDQIERTERMLKLLWREIYEPLYTSGDFINQYHRLDQRSTSIRENARITIRTLLGVF